MQSAISAATSTVLSSRRIKKLFKDLDRPSDGDECYDGCRPSGMFSLPPEEDGRKNALPPSSARRSGGSCRNRGIAYTLSPGQASSVDHLVTKPDDHSDRLLYIPLGGLRINEAKPKHDFAPKLGGAHHGKSFLDAFADNSPVYFV